MKFFRITFLNEQPAADVRVVDEPDITHKLGQVIVRTNVTLRIKASEKGSGIADEVVTEALRQEIYRHKRVVAVYMNSFTLHELCRDAEPWQMRHSGRETTFRQWPVRDCDRLVDGEFFLATEPI